ncbi:hypothetical protein AB6A23_03890 [Paenibacillus tarimensis]
MKEQSSRLGTENIPKLLTSLSVPAFMGMFLSTLFNVIDTIFIARGVGTLGRPMKGERSFRRFKKRWHT